MVGQRGRSQTAIFSGIAALAALAAVGIIAFAAQVLLVCLHGVACHARRTQSTHAQRTHMHTHTHKMREKNGMTYLVASLLAASAAQDKIG